MSADFLVRAATEDDLAAVQSCLAETWHATYDAIFGREQVTLISGRWHAITALQRHLAAPDTNFLIGIEDGAVIGTASGRLVAPGHVSLQWLYVLPRVQGKGYGKRLMNAAIGNFSDARRVTLDVEPRNVHAIAFYEAQGFRRIALEERDHAGVTETAAVFEKIIAAP